MGPGSIKDSARAIGVYYTRTMIALATNRRRILGNIIVDTT